MKLDSIYVRFIEIEWFHVQYLEKLIIYWFFNLENYWSSLDSSKLIDLMFNI